MYEIGFLAAIVEGFVEIQRFTTKRNGSTITYIKNKKKTLYETR